MDAAHVPGPGEVARQLALASGHAENESTRNKLTRLSAIAWLIDHGLACPVGRPDEEKPESSSVVTTTAIGNPTPAALAAEREKNRPRPRLMTTAIDEIEAEEVAWLWGGRIPAGRVTVIMGRQGKGKSTLVSWLAATVSTGRPWPDTPDDNPAGSVLILQAEESAAQDIRPRLDAFGFAPGKIRVIHGVDRGDGEAGAFNLSSDVAVLRDEIERRGDVRLVIVDPVGSYIRGISGYNEAEVRVYLRPLFDLAEECDVAVVLVAHPNKDSEKEVLDRVSGSGAFTQMARMSWFFSDDPRDGSRRLLSLMKGNLHGATRTAIAVSYETRSRRLTWHPDPVDLDAQQVDNLLQKASREAKLHARPGRDPVECNRAIEFLLELLRSGPTLQSAAQDQALNQGIKESSFRKGLKRLLADDGRVRRERRGDEGRWWVFLAEKGAPEPPPEGGENGASGAGESGPGNPPPR